MICDVHAHHVPKQFSNFMGERFTPAIGVPNPAGIKGRLELMDAAGCGRFADPATHLEKLT